MTYARDERAALAALLLETGPDGPTLCEGWQTRDLAAHLVMRERRPDAGLGSMGGPLVGHNARVQRQYLDKYSYPQLVALFKAGPPTLSPYAIPGADNALNTVEFFVHHEDVRRAVPGWTERELPDGINDVFWRQLRGARFLLRSAPTGVVLSWELADGGMRGGTRNAKDASPSVTVTGTPPELALWSFGRVSAAHVTLDGPDEAVARLAAWRQ